MSDDLLPCPFCGQNDLKNDGVDELYTVRCRKCGACGPMCDPEWTPHLHKEKWNRRARASQVAAPDTLPSIPKSYDVYVPELNVKQYVILVDDYLPLRHHATRLQSALSAAEARAEAARVNEDTERLDWVLENCMLTASSREDAPYLYTREQIDAARGKGA